MTPTTWSPPTSSSASRTSSQERRGGRRRRSARELARRVPGETGTRPPRWKACWLRSDKRARESAEAGGHDPTRLRIVLWDMRERAIKRRDEETVLMGPRRLLLVE